MVDSYENLEGKIWLDGELVECKMQNSIYDTRASLWFFCVWRRTSIRWKNIQKLWTFGSENLRICWYGSTVHSDEIETAKRQVLDANGQKDAMWELCLERLWSWYGCCISRNPVRVAVASWEWGAYYGDAKMKGAKLDISHWKRPSPRLYPVSLKHRVYIWFALCRSMPRGQGMFWPWCWITEVMLRKQREQTFFLSRTTKYTPQAWFFLMG